jgi:hypothetical protein
VQIANVGKPSCLPPAVLAKVPLEERDVICDVRALVHRHQLALPQLSDCFIVRLAGPVLELLETLVWFIAWLNHEGIEAQKGVPAQITYSRPNCRGSAAWPL